jgi:6-phosphogluconolactonase
LSPVGNVNVGFNPVFLTLSPSGKFLYVANAAGGTLSAFTVDSAGGLTPIAGSPYPLSTGGTQGAGPNGIAIDPGEHFLFVANLLASTVGGYAIDSTTGALSPLNGQPYTAGTSPASLTFDKTGTYLYVANLTSNNVTAFLIGTNGVPKQLDGSPYAGGTQPAFIQLDPSGEFVFVGTEGAGGRQILSYKINPSSGQLAAQAQSGLASTPTSLVLLK